MKSTDFPQLDLMRAGIQNTFEITIRNFKVTVRPLTNLEIIKATAEAAESLEKLPENQRTSITASLLHAMYQLQKAASEDVGEPSKLPITILERMSPDEINHLWKQYVRVTDKVNPSFEMIGAEEVGRMADELKKNSEPESQLTDLSISNLIALCLHLLKTQPN